MFSISVPNRTSFAERMLGLQLPGCPPSGLKATLITSRTAIVNQQHFSVTRLFNSRLGQTHSPSSACRSRGPHRPSAVPKKVSTNDDAEALRQEALEVLGNMFGVEKPTSDTSQVRTESSPFPITRPSNVDGGAESDPLHPPSMAGQIYHSSTSLL